MAFELSDLTNFYNDNKDSELGKFVISQATTLASNQIQNFTKTGRPSKTSSTIIQTPVIMQNEGSSFGGMSKNTMIYIGVGGVVALVAIIVLMRK